VDTENKHISYTDILEAEITFTKHLGLSFTLIQKLVWPHTPDTTCLCCV